jgi:hypothetical protein
VSQRSVLRRGQDRGRVERVAAVVVVVLLLPLQSRVDVHRLHRRVVERRIERRRSGRADSSRTAVRVRWWWWWQRLPVRRTVAPARDARKTGFDVASIVVIRGVGVGGPVRRRVVASVEWRRGTRWGIGEGVCGRRAVWARDPTRTSGVVVFVAGHAYRAVSYLIVWCFSPLLDDSDSRGKEKSFVASIMFGSRKRGQSKRQTREEDNPGGQVCSWDTRLGGPPISMLLPMLVVVMVMYPMAYQD